MGARPTSWWSTVLSTSKGRTPGGRGPVAKVLTNRLKKFLDLVVPKDRDRSIRDNLLIRELLEGFDRVDHKFLFSTLRTF